ncbi:MAG: DUF1622 domain-containing protein [Chloroflexi bacterium]|nr:DUF1622 domain-containing protein [Chloroflexota bacterium]
MNDLIAEDGLRDGVDLLVRLVETAGAVVIFAGAAFAFFRFVIAAVRDRDAASFVPVRLDLGRFLARGLEFQLASDVLRDRHRPELLPGSRNPRRTRRSRRTRRAPAVSIRADLQGDRRARRRRRHPDRRTPLPLPSSPPALPPPSSAPPSDDGETASCSPSRSGSAPASCASRRTRARTRRRRRRDHRRTPTGDRRLAPLAVVG